MDPPQFHPFKRLPRELQLRIWDLYEADCPHVRHYFRPMVYVNRGCLYGAVLEGVPWTPFSSYRRKYPQGKEPDCNDVADEALTLDTKVSIRLEHNHCFVYNKKEPLSGVSFRRVRNCKKASDNEYRWVNFKLDTFCFTTAVLGHSVFGYIHCIEDDLTHWFYKIQKMDLLIHNDRLRLSYPDKQMIATHPALKTVTLVATIHQLACWHLGIPGVTDRDDDDAEVSRVPLSKVEALLRATGKPAGGFCGHREHALEELQVLRQQLVELIASKHDRHVDVRVEVEMYWASKARDIDVIIARAEKKNKGEQLEEEEEDEENFEDYDYDDEDEDEHKASSAM